MLRVTRIAIVVLIISSCTGRPTEDKSVGQSWTQYGVQLPVEGNLPSLDGATDWINSKPLSREDLRGKVVIIDFWTYTCINWLRTQPYIRAWAEKYKDKGLVVIGVHSPEFEFEKNITNVRRLAKELKVDYPIAVDSDHSVWRAFENQYWPAFYFVDSQGRIRHHQFGEGDYDRSERVIQELLAEAGNVSVDKQLVNVKGEGIEAAADWENLGSPENYTGYGRTENFTSPGGLVRDTLSTYSLPSKFEVNDWGLAGSWRSGMSSVLSSEPTAKIAYRFHGRDVNVVMGPAGGTPSVRFRVLIDAQPPLDSHGVDVDEQGYGKASGQRLYQLIRQPGSISDRQLEIEFLDPGVEVFAFTFG